MRTRTSQFLPILCTSMLIVLAACGVYDAQPVQQQSHIRTCEGPPYSSGCDLCGDGYCAPSEVDTCSADCASAAYCGDGLCNSSETCSTCPGDCGPCNLCGDSLCDGAETCSTCSQDCGPCNVCGDGLCDGAETCSTCAQDCGACSVCGDGTCNGSETCSTCSQDCGACPVCGDGICNNSETCSTCAQDCPPLLTPGNQISTGAIPVTNPNGVLITGLVPGNWYAVETAGGPWYAFPGGSIGPMFYSAWVSNNNGITWWRLNQGVDGNDFTNAWGSSAETFNTNYQRGYWRATTTSIRIRVADNIFDDNSGSLSWVLRSTSSCCSNAYTPGGQLSTGSIPVTNPSGTLITGLVPGTWYSVETTGGPWYAFAGGGGPAFYSASVSNNGGTTWYRLDQGIDNRDFTNAWGAWVETINTNYKRGYWRATTTSIRIQVADSVYSDNNGSLSWILRSTNLCGP